MTDLSEDIVTGINDAVFNCRQPDELAMAIKIEFGKIITGQLSVENENDSMGIIERLIEHVDLEDG
jgi:hypothetical protein